jgi:hypothetical protein
LLAVRNDRFASSRSVTWHRALVHLFFSPFVLRGWARVSLPKLCCWFSGITACLCPWRSPW